MKTLKIFSILLILTLLTSCYKETYPKYITGPEKVDTTKWEDEYVNLGTVPANTGPVINILSGTNWKLVKYMSVFATQTPNDTIHFISKLDTFSYLLL